MVTLATDAGFVQRAGGRLAGLRPGGPCRAPNARPRNLGLLLRQPRGEAAYGVVYCPSSGVRRGHLLGLWPWWSQSPFLSLTSLICVKKT